MKTRNLLLAMALPTLFAACTAEEIVNQADNNAVLANRAVLGDLTVKIENPVASRTSWNDETLKWEEFSEEDVFSAAVVDAIFGHVGDDLLTNYVYSMVNGEWKTNSQMVEGTYSFYSYNGIKDKNDRKPVAFDLTAQTADLDNPTKVIDDNQLFFSPLYKIEAKNVTEGNVIPLPLKFYPYHSIGALKMANTTGQNLMITQIIARGEFAAKGAILPTKIEAAGLNWNVRKGEAEYKLNYKTGKTEYTAEEVEKIWQTADLDNISISAQKTITMNCGNWEWADDDEIMAYMVIPANAKITQVDINVVDENGEAKLIRVADTRTGDRTEGYTIASTGISKQDFKRGTPVSVFGYTSAGKPKSITAKAENLKDAEGYYIDNKDALIELVNSSRGDIDVYNFGELYVDAEIAEVIAEYTGGVVTFINPIEVMDTEEVTISNIIFTNVTVKGEDEAAGFEGSTVVFGDAEAERLVIEAGATVTIEEGTYTSIVNYGTLSVEKPVTGSSIATYNALTVYNGENDITLTQGTLNFATFDKNENGKYDDGEGYVAGLPEIVTYYNAGNYTVNYAKGVILKVKENAVIGHNDSRRSGTLNLGDDLELEADLTVDFRCGMTVDGDTEGTGSMVINGSLTNNGDANVTITVNGSMINNGDTRNVTNNGHITAGKGSRTDVKATTVTDVWNPGEVDNTAKAKVNHEADANQIVYYEVTDGDVDELEEIDFDRFNVNTLYVVGTLEIDRAFGTGSEKTEDVAERMKGLENLKLAKDAKVEIDGTVNTNFKNIYLEGDATIEGWSETESYLVLDREDVNVVMYNKNVKSSSSIDYDKDGYTLTIKDVDVKCSNGVITFYTRKEYNGDDYNVWLEANVVTKDAKFITPLVKGGTSETDIDLDEVVYNNAVAVDSEQELKAMVAKGENVVLTKTIALTEQLRIDKDLTIDLGNFNLTINQTVNNTDGYSNRTIAVLVEGATVTVKGEEGWMKSAGNYVIAAGQGARVIIESGNFDGTVYAKDGGNVTIEGGYFQRSEVEADKYSKPQYTCLNANGGSDKYAIVVKGGTFKNFNPANNWSEGTETNFVHQDYKVSVWNVTGNYTEDGKKHTNGKFFAEIPYDSNWSGIREYAVVKKE